MPIMTIYTYALSVLTLQVIQSYLCALHMIHMHATGFCIARIGNEIMYPKLAMLQVPVYNYWKDCCLLSTSVEAPLWLHGSREACALSMFYCQSFHDIYTLLLSSANRETLLEQVTPAPYLGLQ